VDELRLILAQELEQLAKAERIEPNQVGLDPRIREGPAQIAAQRADLDLVAASLESSRKIERVRRGAGKTEPLVDEE